MGIIYDEGGSKIFKTRYDEPGERHRQIAWMDQSYDESDPRKQISVTW